MAGRIYILDSDVFITAKNLYYAFDICPGFWKCLLYHHRKGKVFSIDSVLHELLKGNKSEDLVQWVQKKVPGSFFCKTDNEEVEIAYKKVMSWVNYDVEHSKTLAKKKFSNGADGWLVAYAMVHSTTIVTNERSAPESKKEIRLPDVCNQFKVQHDNTFEMLRALNVRLNFEGD